MPLDEQPENQLIEDFKYICELPDKADYAKLKATNDLLLAIIDEILKEEVVFFQTIFAKFSFLKNKIALSDDTSKLLNYFRIHFKNLNNKGNIQVPEVLKLTNLGQRLIYYLLVNHYKLDLKNNFSLKESSEWVNPKLKNSKYGSIPFLKK